MKRAVLFMLGLVSDKALQACPSVHELFPITVTPTVDRFVIRHERGCSKLELQFKKVYCVHENLPNDPAQDDPPVQLN